MGDPNVDMEDGRGLEVLMTEGWPTMAPIGGGCGCALMGPDELRCKYGSLLSIL